MVRPRISEDLAEQITQHADGLLSGTPVDAEDLPFERRLEIVFDAARERTGEDAAIETGPAEVDVGSGEEHPGGDAAAEALMIDGL